MIPQMTEGPLFAAAVPLKLLTEYQRNFRFLVFETAAARLLDAYEERIEYQRLSLGHRNETEGIGHVGGLPIWVMEDETPSSLGEETEIHFLLQINEDFTFPILESARRQIKINLAGNAEPSSNPFYRLFLANALYLFGARKPSDCLIYALPQCS